MGTPLLHRGATVRCPHQGSASPLVSNPRVRVGGNDTVVLGNGYVVSNCGANTRCATATYTTNLARRLKSGGKPLVLTNSGAVCVPTGAPLNTESSQQRVKGE